MLLYVIIIIFFAWFIMCNNVYLHNNCHVAWCWVQNHVLVVSSFLRLDFMLVQCLRYLPMSKGLFGIHFCFLDLATFRMVHTPCCGTLPHFLYYCRKTHLRLGLEGSRHGGSLGLVWIVWMALLLHKIGRLHFLTCLLHRLGWSG